MNYYIATPESPYHVSCGGVVYRRKGKKYECALLTRKRDVFPWHLPKGTLEPGEVPEIAALREVVEEAALVGRIRTYLGTTTYTLPSTVVGFQLEKTVLYFLIEYEQDSPDGLDGEYDRCEWFELDVATEKLHNSYKSEDKIILRAKEWLIRHAE